MRVVSRRGFLQSVAVAGAAGAAPRSARERVLGWLKGGEGARHVPAAFFLHFAPEDHRGKRAVEKHLEFFHRTGMDFVKIQYELTFPRLPEVKTPDDWTKVPRYGQEFFKDPLDLVEGLVEAVKGEALVVQTLYSAFMSAGHTASDEVLAAHMKAAPEKVARGLRTIADSTLFFVRECVKRGVDGFYASTQGGEARRFADPSAFSRHVKPLDLEAMAGADRCAFNILHVCDYVAEYDDLTPLLDYPGHVVSCPLRLGGRPLPVREAARLFGRPVMGGLDRHGVIAKGRPEEIQAAVRAVLQSAPERFVLGADCTVPSETSWDNLQVAIKTAHEYRRAL
jgi:uroporphyrinogen decarboxylase